MITTTPLETLLGRLTATLDDEGALLELTWANGDADADVVPMPQQLRTELDAYFQGGAVEFSTTLRPVGTPFQQRVWSLVRAIPYGSTATYSEIARALGRPRSARAVGQANARNPIAVIIPCHRLVGATGQLRGYAGGISVKRELLELEARGLVISHLDM